MTLDHIGIVVEDIDSEIKRFENLHGELTWTSLILEPIQKVYIKFGRTEDGKVYELLQAMGEDSPVLQSAQKKRNVIHHMCYRTDDLVGAVARLRKQGALPVTEPQPAVAFGEHLIQFFFQPSGWLLELVEGNVSPFDIW